MRQAPTPAKTPHVVQDPESSNFAWRFDRPDIHHPEWGWANVAPVVLFERIFPRLYEWETWTWSRISLDKTGGHFIPAVNICPAARRRLREIAPYAENDDLLSLHLTGVERVWAVPSGKTTHILWWDPKHTVYPTTMRNT